MVLTPPRNNAVIAIGSPVLLAVVGLLITSTAVAEVHPTYEQIRPILKEHCFHCHGEAGTTEGKLDLRMKRLIDRGGDSGRVVEPGKPEGSLLLMRIVDGEMPPEEIEKRPTKKQVDLLKSWIKGGAVVGAKEPTDIDPSEYITNDERQFWAFQPIVRPALPAVIASARVQSPVDYFILAKLEERGLTLAPKAGRRDLLRRAFVDMIGMVPEPSEAREYLNDNTPDAYERLLDRLALSPHFGERWARHWLDVAGYADSEGASDSDPVRPNAYKFRDYVIRAFNNGKPADQFIQEQLAGDEMIGRLPLTNLNQSERELLIATGFLRMAPDATGVSNTIDTRNESIAKSIEVISTSLLGLTVACAQCHDHRYDPISQRDYYKFRAIFEPTYDMQKWRTPSARQISLYTEADRKQSALVEAKAKQAEANRSKRQAEFIEAVFQRELKKLPAEMREEVKVARNTPSGKRTPRQSKLLREHPSVNVTAGSLYLYDKKAADELKKMAADVAKIRATKPKEEFVRAANEVQGRVPDSHVFFRGSPQQPKDKVGPAELTILGNAGTELKIAANTKKIPSTGRRLAYAQRLTDGQHPLVARVIVNRIWLHYFGRGLVTTPGDFGQLGNRPTHPRLLDWLADELMQNDWNQRHIQRLIMRSSTYQQAVNSADERAAREDTDNRLYWKKPQRRLDAEALRDSTLVVSGLMNDRQHGPAVPVMADRVGQFVIGIENLNAGRPGPVIPMRGEDLRRSIYIQVRRSRPLGVLETFDAPRMDPNCTVRNSSTVAPQALHLMNSQFVQQHAKALARRVASQHPGNQRKQIATAWQITYTREPSEGELEAAIAFVNDQEKNFASLYQKNEDKNGEARRQLALTSFCHALLSSSEFLYIE